MAQGRTTTVEATGVLFSRRSDDPAELVDAAGRQPVIMVNSRLREAGSPIDDNKLTPFLGVFGQLVAGQRPEVFVVKVIAVPPGQTVVPPAAARLLENEQEAAARNGLQLAGVPAVGMGGGYAWVVRAYINGLTIGQLRNQGDLAGNEVLLARLVLARIVELHGRTYRGRPLFHGDIKPANVIVRVDRGTIDGVELIDFESGGSSGDTGPAYRHATLQFASPEHFLAATIDQPADVFSWGLTVLDMYAPGRHPFVPLGADGRVPADPDAYREAYGTGRTADQHLLAAITDPALRNAVRDALTVRSDLRPTARDLLARLDAAHPPRPPAPVSVQAPTTTVQVAHAEAVTRVAPTGVVPTPLAAAAPPAPAVYPTAALPAQTADPDSVPAQLSGWWQQVFTARGYLCAADFGPWHWTGYLVATVCLGATAGMLLGVLLLSIGRILLP